MYRDFKRQKRPTTTTTTMMSTLPPLFPLSFPLLSFSFPLLFLAFPFRFFRARPLARSVARSKIHTHIQKQTNKLILPPPFESSRHKEEMENTPPLCSYIRIIYIYIRTCIHIPIHASGRFYPLPRTH